jgi:hypothetical protein
MKNSHLTTHVSFSPPLEGKQILVFLAKFTQKKVRKTFSEFFLDEKEIFGDGVRIFLFSFDVLDLISLLTIHYNYDCPFLYPSKYLAP